jgi:F-type H+-transporting ATPase subunit epsilon
MPKTFKLQVVIPDREVLAEEVTSVMVPGGDGEFTVWARHASLLSNLRPGTLTIVSENKKSFYFVSGGFIEVTPASVTVLAEEFEPAGEINQEKAERAKKDARAILAKPKEKAEIQAAKASLARALARLKAVQQSQAPTK